MDITSLTAVELGKKIKAKEISVVEAVKASIAQIENVDRLSKAELQCSLCLLDIVIDGLSKDEFSCPNKELIRLVIMYVYIQERFDLCEIKELHTKLVMTPVKKKKE